MPAKAARTDPTEARFQLANMVHSMPIISLADHVILPLKFSTSLILLQRGLAYELYADLNDGKASTSSEGNDVDIAESNSGVEYEVIGEDGQVVLRTNRAIMDDSSSQTMTIVQIEAFRAEGTGSGRNLIQKILDLYIALNQKTAFALAKYTLRKTKKYLRRFRILRGER